MLRGVFKPLAKTEIPKPEGKLICPGGAITRVADVAGLGGLLDDVEVALGAARVAVKTGTCVAGIVDATEGEVARVAAMVG
jgi:hypothetical protein